jgi:ubiquinone biosynthesis protein UbiJ
MSLLAVSQPLVATLNHLLAKQAGLRALLSSHAAKEALFDLGLIQLRLGVAADGLVQALSLDASAADSAHVCITLQPADLPIILADPKRAMALVRIHGDAEFARTISEVATHLRWEAEEDLAPIVGDIAAVRMVQAARSAGQQIKQGSIQLIQQCAEYLLEENPTLLYRSTGEGFGADVAVLRDDVERLAKRIALLEARTGAPR